VILPATITAIPNYFFANCVNLAPLDWSRHLSLASIGEGAFRNVSWTSLTLPSGITSLGKYAFENCPALATVDISAIQVAAFSMLYFRGSAALETLVLPDATTSIEGPITTSDYPKFKRITIPASLEAVTGSQWYSNLFDEAFRPADFTFEVAPGHTKFSALLDGKALAETLEGGGKRLVFYPSASGAANIPGDITEVGSFAFQGSSITSLDIPAAVTTIGSSAFALCNGLTSLTIPATVTTIGGSAFAGCNGLTSITIPDTVTALGAGAFSNCGNVSSITLGTGLASIPGSAFSGCAKLTGVIAIPANITTIGGSAFSTAGTASGFSVVLHSGVTDISNAFAGSGLTAINIPASITSLVPSAFMNSTRLASIDLSALAITTLPSQIFYGGTALAAVTLPPNLGSIELRAFYNCTALSQIELPATLTTLGYHTSANTGHVFDGSGLTSVTLPASLTTIYVHAFDYCANLQWVKILKTDGLLPLPASYGFPFRNNSTTPPTYFPIYVPDELLIAYQGDADAEPVVASKWTNCPSAALPYIRPLSQFATDFPD
jgi:hypothetical protein